MVMAFVQGVAGFGFALLAVPFFALVLPVKEAVVLSTLVGTANSCFQVVALRRNIDVVRAQRYLIGSLLGAPLGFALYQRSSTIVLRAIVGIAVVLGTVMVVRAPRHTSARPRLDWGMALVSGVLLTSTSTNGPPLVVALRAQGVQPDSFRATLAVVFAVTGAAATMGFAVAGNIDHETAWLSAWALPSLLIGASTGQRARVFVAGAMFTWLVALILMVGAASSIAPAILHLAG